jgi:hypothetical protein
MPYLKAGYVIDESRWEELNRQGRNYWWAYIAEILDRVGLTASPVRLTELRERLPEFTVLFIGDAPVRDLVSDLKTWVDEGGMLVGCMTEGLDDLFGNEYAGRIPQPGDEFSIAGELYLDEYQAATEEVRCPIHAGKPLLIISDIRLVRRVDSIPLGEVNGQPVITIWKPRIGYSVYFGFDLAQTFWAIQQGRPVDADHDGDGYLRTGDAIVIGDYEPEIPYTDELLRLLENILYSAHIPLIHQLPPTGDVVPDVLLFYGGDDEGSEGIQVPAAEFMAGRGLPYHINCMQLCGKYGLGPGEIERLRGLGTELSAHFNFIDGFAHPTGFTRDDVERQARAFVERFGHTPVCSNFHWCRWSGYAEPALWLAEQGIGADNSYAHRPLHVLNPVNSIGFAFGTSFPFHFYADHSMGNRRIDVLELPITAYEVGYTAEETDFPTLERALRLAVHYGLTMNFFYHPVYLAQHQTCRDTIDRLLSLIKDWGITAVHSAPDALTRWWNDRSRTVIEDAHWLGDGLAFTARTPSPQGFIAKIPYSGLKPPWTNLPHKVVHKRLRGWLMIVLPPGETQVEVRL